MKRVVVTGLGAVSPLGIGVPALWEGLVAGRSGVRHVQHFATENLTVKIAAEVPDFDPKAFMDPKSVRRMDRFAHFAIAGTQEALADAKLEITDENRDRVAVVMNTGGGGIPTMYRPGTRTLVGVEAVEPAPGTLFVCAMFCAFGTPPASPGSPARMSAAIGVMRNASSKPRLLK